MTNSIYWFLAKKKKLNLLMGINISRSFITTYSFVCCNTECPRDWNSCPTAHGNTIQKSHLQEDNYFTTVISLASGYYSQNITLKLNFLKLFKQPCSHVMLALKVYLYNFTLLYMHEWYVSNDCWFWGEKQT